MGLREVNRTWRSLFHFPDAVIGGIGFFALAIGLLSQGQRRGLQPVYVLSDSWYAAAELMNLLQGWDWQ